MTIQYTKGQFNGRQESFYPDGSLKSEAVYKNGELQGKKKTYAEKEKPMQEVKEKDMPKEKAPVKGKPVDMPTGKAKEKKG